MCRLFHRLLFGVAYLIITIYYIYLLYIIFIYIYIFLCTKCINVVKIHKSPIENKYYKKEYFSELYVFCTQDKNNVHRIKILLAKM